MTRSDGASGRMCHGLPAANFRVTLSAKSRLVPDSNAAETPRRCVSVPPTSGQNKEIEREFFTLLGTTRGAGGQFLTCAVLHQWGLE